ncbi:MAG: NAD(P)-binding protein [Candidatus Promineifilaceae bacterium]
MKNLNIGIVGGTIAGCSAAIVMARAGHRVSVFE